MFRKRISATQLRGVALALMVGSLFSFAAGHALGQRADAPARGASTARVEQTTGALGTPLPSQPVTMRAAPAQSQSQHDDAHHGRHKQGRPHHADAGDEGDEGDGGGNQGGHGGGEQHGGSGRSGGSGD